ncbi:MAG: efflux RND transporter periplasmic adaptor subunit [Nitrospirota bacterium]
MNSARRPKGILTAVVVLSLIIGLVGGYVLAHRSTSEMASTGKAGVSREKERVLAGSGRAGEIGLAGWEGEKGKASVPQEKDPVMDMKDMPGMAPSAVPSGAVVLPAVQQQLIGVRTTEVSYAPLGQEIRAVGTINYDERKLTQVNLRVAGWIQKVLVDAVGKPVRKGEPLLTLYSPDLLATQDEYLLALRSQAQLAGSPMPDAKTGAEALVSSARERLKLWSFTDQQIAELERRGKAEPVITVYAPSSGIVLKREALPGKYVDPGTTLYELADLSTVWIYADVYESQIAGVKLNQPAAATFDAYPGETFQGKVQYIYPYLNETTRTVRVRLELPNPILKLKPGMYGNVLIHTDQQERLVVPKEAVLDTGVRQIVFLDKGNGIYLPTEVKLGRRSEDKVEVLAGLKEGDHVVTAANFLLDAQSKLASTGNMQQMMGQVGMADWQMRGAYEAKMEGMEGSKGMQGMKDMPGMSPSAPAKPVSETRRVSGYVLTLGTTPNIPKAGEIMLRLKLTGPDRKPVTNANVLFVYTMAMPGMSEIKAHAVHTKDGVYEGKAMLGMAGTWEVRVSVTVPGRPAIAEKFQLAVAGGGM